MNPIMSSENCVDDLFAFDLGVLTNTLMWHYDQAVYVADEQQRKLALGLTERIRAKVACLPLSASIPLINVVNRIQNCLRQLDFEDFQEAALIVMYEAHDRNEEPSGRVWYHQEMQSRVQDFRNELERAIADEVLTTARLRWSFHIGGLIDAGRHPRNVAEYVFGQEKIEHRSTPRSSPLVDAVSVTTSPFLQTFRPGELPPEVGWWERVEAVFAEIELPCSVDRRIQQTSAATAVDVFESAIRSFLAKSNQANFCDDAPTPAAGDMNLSSDTLFVMSRRESDAVDQSSIHAKTSHYEGYEVESNPPPYAANQSEITALAAAHDLGPPLAAAEAAVKPAQSSVVTMPPVPTVREVSDEQTGGETLGNWTFFDAEVQFGELPNFVMTNPYKGILKLLLKRSTFISWELLADAGWGESNVRTATDVTQNICRLRDHLKAYLEPHLKERFPAKAILSKGKNKDLSYRIDDLLR